MVIIKQKGVGKRLGPPQNMIPGACSYLQSLSFLVYAMENIKSTLHKPITGTWIYTKVLFAK